jgi:hypothetical protein
VKATEAAVYEAKTQPTNLSVAAYLGGIGDEARRKDCRELTSLMKRLTGCSPKMWGTSIVGFDSYHYKYASGHEGDSCVVGYSSRKGDISVYLAAGYDSPEAKELLAKLGRHGIGKACLSIKRLSDVRLPVLEQLIIRSVAETKRRYPRAASGA